MSTGFQYAPLQYRLEWDRLDWTGFVNGGFVNHGFVKGKKHGFLNGGFVNHGFFKGGFVKHGFFKVICFFRSRMARVLTLSPSPPLSVVEFNNKMVICQVTIEKAITVHYKKLISMSTDNSPA